MNHDDTTSTTKTGGKLGKLQPSTTLKEEKGKATDKHSAAAGRNQNLNTNLR